MQQRSSSRPGRSADRVAPATPPSEVPPLVSGFQALSPTDVYLMAPKLCVVRGFEYYRQRRVQDYEWSVDRSTLTARVRGTRFYAVTFSMAGGELSAECDCPAWIHDGQCKHVLCACFTTLNLLMPHCFTLPEGPDERAAALRARLLPAVPPPNETDAHPRADPTYAIVLDVRFATPWLTIRRNGAPVIWSAPSTVPPEFAPLLRQGWFVPGFGTDPLLAYLKRHANRHPIVLETAEGAVTLRWEPSVKCRSRTELDAAGDTVGIRARYEAEGVGLERLVRFRSLVADPNAGRLLCLEDDRGWALYRALQRLESRDPFLDPSDWPVKDQGAVIFPLPPGSGSYPGPDPDHELAVPLRDFQALQIDLACQHADRILRRLLFKVDGREAPPLRRDEGPPGEGPSYRLVLVPPPGSGEAAPGPWRLRAEGTWDTRRLRPSTSLFEWLSSLEQGRAVSAPLRAHKRKAALYRAFFTLLPVADAEERERRLRLALSGPEFRSRAVKQEAHRLVRGSLAVYARPDARVHLRNGRWELRPVDKAREALLYRIPYELFGPQIFRDMRRYDEMALDAGALSRRLPDLLQRLNDAGIELCCDNQTVRTSRWECALEVGRRAGRAGIDWFEIRPEVRCDGAVLDEAVWQEAVRQGGLTYTKHGLRVLDAATLERLRLLGDLSAQARRSRPKAARIVTVPRLQILDWIALREKGVRVSLPEEDERVVARLLGFERITNPPLPKALRARLRAYQQDGYGWLAFLYQHRFGACLADDMGLGKTLQAISVLAAIKEGLLRPPEGAGGPHLVVAPTSLLFNWEQELARFAPGLKVRARTGRDPVSEGGDVDVVLTTYGQMRRNIDTLAKVRFHVVVFDEAQAVKNLFANTTGAARRLNGAFKLALTGTPLENHLGEYFSILDLCLPGLLGDYDAFRSGWKRAHGAALGRLLRRTRPFVLRRTKAQILRDLPPKTEREVFLDLTGRQKALYQQTVAQVRSTIDEAYASRAPAQAQLIALTAILKLRQVCLSPRLLTRRPEEPSPKLEFLLERLQVLLEEHHSALVFSQFTSFLDLVEEACARHRVPHWRLDGATAAGARKARVTAFQTADTPGVFLLSLKAGGQGLNLTRATYVFHLDPWWNPAVENQASDRAHRIGQQRAVSVVRILMRHTIEEKMLALKQRKLELYEAVMGSAIRGAGRAVLTKADFDFLLSPGSEPA